MRIALLKHLLAGFLISGLTSFGIHFWSYDWMILSALVAFVIGIMKELIWDNWWKRGTPEWQDAFATLWGGLGASFLCYIIWY